MSEWDNINGFEQWSAKLGELLGEAREAARNPDSNARFAVSDRLTEFILNSRPNDEAIKALDDLAARTSQDLMLGILDERLKEIVGRTAEWHQLTKQFSEHAASAGAQAAAIRLEKAHRVAQSLTESVNLLQDLRSSLSDTDDPEFSRNVSEAVETLQKLRAQIERMVDANKRQGTKPTLHKRSAKFKMLGHDIAFPDFSLDKALVSDNTGFTRAKPPEPEVPRVKGEPGEASPVRLGASAPAACRPGDEFTARFVAYPPGDEAEVDAVLRKLSPRSKTHLGLEQCLWKPGTPVRVSLAGKGLAIDPEVQQFVWQGGRVLLSFDVTVPAATPEGTVVLKFDVAIDGITVARLRMDLEIRDGADKRDIHTARSRAASSAFASYSRQDRQRVLDRIATLQINTGMDIFLDCLSLHPGQKWQPRLDQEIRNRDLFLLFWSKPASQSKWVEWEWRRALDEGKKDDMEIHPLENDVKPPPELSDLHFADPTMAVRAANAPPP